MQLQCSPPIGLSRAGGRDVRLSYKERLLAFRDKLATRAEKRAGSAVNHAMTKGIVIIVQIIMLVIAGYFAALLVPGLLTAFATTALTSVSAAVITLFQTILPFTFVTVVILLFLAVLVETFKEI